MKFGDMPVEIVGIRMIRPYKGAKLKDCPVLKIVQSPENPSAEYELYTEGDVIIAEPVDGREAASKLDRELSSDPSYLAQITDIDAAGGFTLEVAFFAREPLEMGEQDIGVDEYIAEQMGIITGRPNSGVTDVLCEGLFQEFCYMRGNDCFFFILAGAAAESEFETGLDGQGPQTPEKELPNSQKGLAPSRANSFCVLSNDISFVATEKPISYAGSICIATKMHERKGEQDKAIRLVHGKLSFVDWSEAGQIQILAKAQLATIAQENSSYLKTWDEFGNIEGEILLRDAREFGVIYYNNAFENRDGTTTVTVTQATATAYGELAGGRVEWLESRDEIPSYIDDPNMEFSTFSRQITEANWKPTDRHEVLGYDESSRQITLGVEHLPSSGKLTLSLQGDMTQIKRRNHARHAIREGRSANPQLGLLLEESGRISTLRLPKKVKALNAYVRGKVFKNDPTYKQEEAIAVALNTPDIALIQGPPGTGKTTVIAAIVERLNQESTKSGSDAKGQVLLTGFQHDAVENMIDRISLNSIPVPKIGRRSGQDDDITAFERSLESWCENIVSGIKSKYPDLDRASQSQEADQLIEQYIMAPTQGLAATLTRMISEMPVEILGEECVSDAKRLSRRLSVRTSLSSAEGGKYIRAARLIRTSESAFLDDGTDRAEDALDVLYDVLEPEECKLLQDVADWPASKGMPPFAGEVKALKRTLMLRLTAPPVFRVEKTNQEVLNLLRKYKRMQERAADNIEDKRLAALAEFVANLQSNGPGIIDAISEYSFAFAATCQQSAGKKMQSLKGVGGTDDSAGLEYDYVIVDEAARVSPRDLMVPMAQGKRIILVGDHRQLPHIVDEEVAQQMERDGADVNEAEWLKKSMFEYLFTERLKALENQDGIVRRVTLDKQFRMHPVIGDFISRNFYERFDPAEKVYSGLPASAFSHNLPGTSNKPVAWLEVPVAMGAHTRRGTSWVRQAEIDAIADQLFEWMNSEEGKSLTFGVISFYKAQADLIRKSLVKLGADEKRLRVGTVDSFQGMEFDVVFLSMVRTLPKNFDGELRQPRNSPVAVEEESRSGALFGRIRRIFDNGSENPMRTAESNAALSGNHLARANPEEQKQAQRLFGHLCLYNRLNVAMSRQKRLLVVAGDSSLLSIELAEAFIPGLVDFYDLCQKEGVVIPCRQ